jgi:hypothetical protein
LSLDKWDSKFLEISFLPFKIIIIVKKVYLDRKQNQIWVVTGKIKECNEKKLNENKDRNKQKKNKSKVKNRYSLEFFLKKEENP